MQFDRLDTDLDGYLTSEDLARHYELDERAKAVVFGSQGFDSARLNKRDFVKKFIKLIKKLY